MKKILGIAAVLVLAGVTASANERTTDQPTIQSAQFAQLGQGSLASERGVAACELDFCGLNTALFMGDENKDGLLKCPHAYALDQLQFRSNPGSATEADALRDGKIDVSTISMSGACAAPTSSGKVSFAAPPTSITGSEASAS